MPRLSPEQIADRRNGMGATDVVEVALSDIGQVPWSGASPMRVFVRKRGLIAEDPPTPEQEWGHWQERLLLQWYEHEIGAPTLPGGTVHDLIETWLWATLDAKCVGQSRNVEVKNVGRWMCNGWDENADDGIPHHVRAQVMIGMYCTKATETDVVASLGGSPPRVWRIAYDRELAEMLVEKGRRFWIDNVQADKAPELDETSSTRAYLDARYPKELDPVILDATPEQVEIGNELRHHRAVHAASKSEEAKAYARLLEQVGTASGLRCEAWKITWKTQASGKRVPRFTSRGEDDK
jgi:predicted phage-related endonuclease